MNRRKLLKTLGLAVIVAIAPQIALGEVVMRRSTRRTFRYSAYPPMNFPYNCRCTIHEHGPVVANWCEAEGGEDYVV